MQTRTELHHSAFIAAPLPFTARRRARPCLAHRTVCAQCSDASKTSGGRSTDGRTGRFSQERRRKISESLKGRRLSSAHRSKLSARFTGSNNPNFGRRLSAETRAKIGAAVSAASARRRSNSALKPETRAGAASAPAKPKVAHDTKKPSGKAQLENLGGLAELRAKAVASRLLAGGPSAAEEAEAASVERLLRRVRAGAVPPEAVARGRRAGRDTRDAGSNESTCKPCSGSGYVRCAKCSAKFGTVSARCTHCLGVGSVFCEACQGAGVPAKVKGAR